MPPIIRTKLKFVSFVILIAAIAFFSFHFYIPKNKSEAQIIISGKKINLEVVKSWDEMQTGLSGREALPSDAGMLFDLQPKGLMPSFWMKDMLFPIDIIWIADNKIVGIEKNIPVPRVGQEYPKRYRPKQPVDFVLEVNAGYTENNNINVGDEVQIIGI